MTEKSTAIRFYTDTHIAKAVAVQLRNHGIDIIRCEEVDMADAKDFEHLEYATQEGQVMITNDDDFLVLDAAWREQGKTHAGIMHYRAQGEIAIGILVRECLDYFNLVESGAANIETDIINHVIFVG